MGIGFSHLKNLSMLKFNQTRDALSARFSHLKNLSMLKYHFQQQFF